MLLLIDGNLAVCKKFSPCFQRFFCSSKYRAYSGKEFHNTKRFCYIIIGAEIESLHDIKFSSFCCHHDDGNILQRACAADFLQNGKSVLSGEHDVKQNEIGHVLLDGFIKFARIAESLYFISLPSHGITDKFPDTFIIFYAVN